MVGRLSEQARLCGGRALYLDVLGDRNLLHRLSHLHKLRCAGFGVSFELPAFGPVIGAVVVTDIAQQQAGFSPMNDQPDVAAHPNRPKPVIFRAIELMELQSWMSRVQLEIEGRSLDGLLLLASQL